MKNIKLLLYCCKDKRGYLHFDTREEITRKYYLSPDSSPFGTYEPNNYLNGKILAECDFEVEKIYFEDNSDIAIGSFYGELLTDTLSEEDLCKKSCLTDGQLYGYLENGTGYAIHIKNLHIFDKPRELNEYYNSKDYCKTWQPIKNAPQNMMYADYINIEQNMFRHYILISIRPEWMCLILNKDKTVEIRKRVLKEMIDNVL